MKFVRPFFLASLVAFTGGLMVCARAQSGSGEKFRPQFSPRFSAGQSFGFQASARLDSTYRIVELKQAAATANITQDTLDNTRVNYDLELTTDGAFARDVFSNGTLREADFLVKRAQIVQSDGKTETLAPAGSILGARKLDDGRTVFAIDGKTPAADVSNYLGMLIQLGDPRTTDGELFGPAAPVPVGGSWILNPKLLLGSGYAQVFSGPLQAAGSMSLQGVQRDNAGRVVATVSGDFRLSGVKPPFPSQVQAKPSTVEYQYQATAPVAAGAGEHVLHLKTLIHHEGVTGNVSEGFSESRMSIGITLDQSARYTIDPARAPIRALATAPTVPSVAPLAATPPAASAQFVSRDSLDAEKNKPASSAAPEKSPSSSATAAASPPARPGSAGGTSLSSQPASALTGKTSTANPASPPAAAAPSLPSSAAAPLLPAAPGSRASVAATPALIPSALPASPVAAAPAAAAPAALPSASPAAVPAPVASAPPSLPTLDSSPAASPLAGAQPLNPASSSTTFSGAKPLAPANNSPAFTDAKPLIPSANASTLAGAQPLTPSANGSPLAGAKPLTPANASGNTTASAFAGAIPLNPGNSTPAPKPPASAPANPSPFAGALPLMPATGNTTNTTVSP